MYYWIASLFIITLVILYHCRDDALQWIKQRLHQKYGLVKVKEINASYQGKVFTVHIEGVHLRIPSNDALPITTTSFLGRIPKPVIECVLNLPMRVFMHLISSRVALHIDDLVIEKNTSLARIKHIYIDFKSTHSMGAQIGPIQVCKKVAEKSFVVFEITTLCLVTLSCHLEKGITRIRLKEVDLDVALGKVNINLNHTLFEHKSNNSNNDGIHYWKNDILKSIRVKVQLLCVNYDTMCLKINSICSTIQPQLQVNLDTELIEFNLLDASLFTMPTMEIKLSQSDHSSNIALHAVPPNISFLSLTWILNSPTLRIPVHREDAMRLFMQRNQQSSSPLVIREKILPELPMFTFALVMNSPKIEVVNFDRCTGYISTSSFILRLSGEYMNGEATNGSTDSMISSSSSSNLDALFAQEEYQWLKTARPKATTQRWLNLMGRVSRRVHVQHPQPSQKKWSYRTSAKVIAQKFDLGYTNSQGINKEFLRIKNTVLVVKMKLAVVPNGDCYNTVFSLVNNMVHAEAALEKPVVHLWDSFEDVPASVFWIKSLPESVSKYKIQQQQQQQQQGALIHTLIRNMCFSLDVIKGSIVAISMDTQDEEPAANVPPSGYFYNTPNEQVYSKLILDTQKFTFACDVNDEKAEWTGRCHMENLYIQQTSHVLNKDTANDDERKKQHVLLWISQLNVNAKLVGQCISISSKVKKYGIFYSIRNHYTCLLFARSLQRMKHLVSTNSKQKSTSFVFEIDTHIGRGDIQICLPQDVKLYVRVDDLLLQHSGFPTVKFRNLMVLGVSPLHEGAWEQILEIDKAQIASKQRGIELKSRKVFVSVPYNYVLSAVLENVIGLVKAIKELHSRILFNRAFTYFGPTVNNDPIVIPCIHIKTRIFTIHFDDDPFEAKLRNIFRTGLVEQQKRLAYREALDERIREMASSDSMSSLDQDKATADPQIEQINSNLLERFSELWIKNINKVKKEEASFFNDFHVREHYRNSVTSDVLDESLDEPQRLESYTFMIDIQPRPLYPPLANFSAHFVKVSFQPVDFSPLETRQFINTIGGGVPLNNDFSIIIPFHLSIKAGRTWIKMRDYPLPLMYVPPPSPTTTVDDNISAKSSTRNNSHVSWTLEGNYAIGDELGNSGGSRIIPVLIVPSTSCSGYLLSAVRTASPLKFYSVIDYHVYTKSMSIIGWSISYNPAIQDIMRVLDSLTAPSVDPSPRVGFWDKVRMVIHTQTKISFTGGGDLAIVVKGTRDPYQLQGHGAGLAKVWRNNVVWLLGYKNPQNEFMQFLSRDYAFGVPDLNRDDYVPNFPDSLPLQKTGGESKSKFLKVALKLSDGIRMGIGLHFERLVCSQTRGVCFKCASVHRIDRCRSQQFSPHYNIIYQSVKQVEANYDKVKKIKKNNPRTLSLTFFHVEYVRCI